MNFLTDHHHFLLKEINEECRGLFWFQKEDDSLTALMDYLLDEIKVFDQAHLDRNHLFFGKSFNKSFFVLKLQGDFEEYQDFLKRNHQVFESSLNYGEGQKEFVGIVGKRMTDKELAAIKKVVPLAQFKIIG